MKTNDITKVAKIVAERTHGVPVHDSERDHEEQKHSRMGCCLFPAIVEDGYEICVCMPSARSKGDARAAFFTFKKL